MSLRGLMTTIGGIKFPWGNGEDGFLHIVNGQTVILGAGTKSYIGVQIDAGGILELSGNNWTQISCGLDFINNGIIRGISNTIWASEIFSYAPDGLYLSHTLPTVTGGYGGRGPNAGYPASQIRASQSSGNGAGGSSLYQTGGASNPSKGGDGAVRVTVYPSVTFYPPAAIGGNICGENGQVGTSAQFLENCAGGGAGGSRGYNGGHIYIKSQGYITGNGTFLMYGSNGGSGGNGGGDNGLTDGGVSHGYSAGGGGAGAGGTGGKIILRAHKGITLSDTSYSGTPYLLSAGIAGSIGNAGSTTVTVYISENGGTAQNGSIGSTDIATY